MDFSGTVEIDAPRDAVWALLLDFEQLAGCGPGVQSIERLDPMHARVKARIGVGFMTLGFTIELELVEVEAPDRAVIRATGDAPGNQAEAHGQMRLTGPAEGPTTMTYEATVELFGSLAGVGSRMIEGTAGKLLDQTFDCVRAARRPPGASRRLTARVEALHRVIGVLATNVHVLADERTREAIAIDTAIPSLEWIRGELDSRGWTLKFIVTTHGHWDHSGDNARVAEHTGAQIAVHPLDAHRLTSPTAMWAPFEIPPSVPAVDLAEGGEIRVGSVRLEVLHTPGHTEGSVCLLDREGGRLYSGDTLFAGSFGRVDLPGGSVEEMVASLDRLRALDETLTVLPGHGPSTTIRAERPWLEWVAREGRLPT